MKTQTIAAGEFKARCLQLMDEVNREGVEVIITKRGQPVARLVPVVTPAPIDIFGSMRGTVVINEDIVSPDPGSWGELS